MIESGYINPGRLFIERHPPPRQADGLSGYVERFANFLLKESGLCTDPPIDLDGICRHFGVTLADVPLGSDRGGGSFGPTGLILINEDDPETRRRFTKGHELVELLFAALKEARVSDEVWHHLSGRPKERLCDRGAAALLLPLPPLVASLEADGLSIASIHSIAKSFSASPLATLIRAVEDGPGCHVLIGWHYALKPTQRRRISDGAQLGLGADLEVMPQPKLRVKWVRGSRAQTPPYIPRHKSIPASSLVVQCYEEGRMTEGYEELDLGRLRGRCFVEALPQHPSSDTRVLTLLHLPDDRACLSRKNGRSA